MRFFFLALLSLFFFSRVATAAFFSGSALVPTGGLLLLPIYAWPVSAPSRWSSVGLPGYVALTFDVASVFARDQHCLDVSTNRQRPCGVDALSHALLLATDTGLVCTVLDRADPVPVWLPSARGSAEESSPGYIVFALRARCSTSSVSDLGLALVRSGHAVPRSDVPMSHPARAALVSARRSRAGVWGYAVASSFVAPSLWETNRLQLLSEVSSR